MFQQITAAVGVWSVSVLAAAESVVPGDVATSLLFPLLSQGPVAAILAFMLWQQAQDKKNEQLLRQQANDAILRLGHSVSKQSRAILIFSLKLDPKNNAEVRELLRELGEDTGDG